MKQRDTVTRTVQVLDILPGDPPQILTAERLRRNGKPGRLVQQLVPVPDSNLFARLAARVSKGDTITITVVTEWHGTQYQSSLSDFLLLAPVTTELPEEARA
jgi:hypothetical protein